jgi:hypothetical protein
MAKIEDRLNRLEGAVKRLDQCEAADMSPAERRRRILELVAHELGLDRPMTDTEYEEWLLAHYAWAIALPTRPPILDEREPVRARLEALRARTAWDLAARRRVCPSTRKEDIVYNEVGA